ncbi:uncharacterized protein K452DRAFT_224692 [Aplosporella prunicola CBS 121167]|uniref:Arginase n=1 Tax=Aplosporella prunicola CBS 121167 TaxID=1176127 RepID=A0A6A6BHQ7_9PEZI|nr:uncharacterized protein K452DRAFT_224692 [Aplosporella prunicola CBS 121167]KAF2143526.1 hypothetical protein K452DRAFT_224692 [Aplosporella prunicola CBS 121167]
MTPPTRTPKPHKSLALILSPYHVGLPHHRVGAGPDRLAPALAAQLASLLPFNAITITTLPAVHASAEGEMGRTFALLTHLSRAVAAAKARGAFPLVLAGNCCSTVGVAAGLRVAEEISKKGDATDDGLGFVWIDAHDDLDTPDTNENGYLDATAAAMLAGGCFRRLLATVPGHVPRGLAGRFAYCGLRDVTALQRGAVRDAGVDVVWGSTEQRVDFAGELRAVLRGRGAGFGSRAVVHFDLDSIDQSVGHANEFPSFGGLLEEDVLGVMGVLTEEGAIPPAAITVCSFNPDCKDGDRVADVAIKGVVKFVEGLLARGILVPE